MLRGLLLALVLANLTFFVWSQGGLRTTGGSTAAGEHEPERLLRQVHPEAVQLLSPSVAASTPVAGVSAASAAASTVSGVEATSAASSAASESASAPAPAGTSASAAVQVSAASAASAGSVAVLALAPAPPPPPAPPGTRCLEAGPFNGVELASAETALAANAKTRRIARRWVQVTPVAASAPSTPQHQLRIDATPSEVAVLDSLPASVVGRSFTPCLAR